MRLHSIQVWQVLASPPGRARGQPDWPLERSTRWVSRVLRLLHFSTGSPLGGKASIPFPLLPTASIHWHPLIVPFWRPTTMPTRNVVISEHQQDFVETLVQ